MDWAERFMTLRRWKRGEERAAHKPLLVLYALGHFQRNGNIPIVFSQAEDQLGQLLREFGPPRATTPAYPFHHLTSDGFWLVSTDSGDGSPGSSPAALRRQHASGRLVPELARDLHSEPALIAQLAHAVLDTNFEPSLHEDICAAVGLSLEEAEAGVAGGSDGRRRRRDPEFPRLVLMAYERRCAFCGYDGSLDGSAPGLEAAHVRWWTHGGPSEVANGLCLCSIHHKLFDKGVLGLTEQHQITVSARFVGRSQTAERFVLSLAGQPVTPPMKGYPVVAAPFAAWHAREVFRPPARVA